MFLRRIDRFLGERGDSVETQEGVRGDRRTGGHSADGGGRYAVNGDELTSAPTPLDDMTWPTDSATK